ncbi:MAG: family transporter, partial [Xanthomonadaceae bacterium]|nr:family transporter [Xanthomonadaceae bacterium]
MNPPADVAIAAFLRRLQWGLSVFVIGWLVWLLAPVLTPFVFAALLGWLGDPLVDRIERRGASRNIAVMIVFGAMALLLLAVLMLLLPLLQHQVYILVTSLPHYRDWLIGTVLPWISARTGLQLVEWLDPQRLVELVRTHWEQAGGFAATVLGYVSRSGFALLGWMANIVLMPVLTFFFLRDWDYIVERVAALVPRDHAATVARLAGESDEVLGGFLRGQLLVMLILGGLYASGLWLVGLDLGILIGLIAGLLTFVPYLGPATVIILGG